MKDSLAENWLRLVRLYTYYFPLRKGKYRLFQFALNTAKKIPNNRQIYSRDGRVFDAKMETGMYQTVYFFGEYENYVTEVIGKVVQSDDVCLDVGANFGWFTTYLFNLRKISGKNVKEIHAFEPLDYVFENLCENIKLAGSPANIFPNNFALSDKETDTKIYINEKFGSGHSSLKQIGSEKLIEKTITTKTLDSYISDKKLSQIDFIKVDIEGSEMSFLKGAEKLFLQKIPPIMVIEMALGTSKYFGYLPNDLIEFIARRGEYDFFALIEKNCSLKKINGFPPDDIGANVLCFPRNADKSRLKGLKFID